MTAELGHLTLVLALGVAFVQAIIPLIGAQRRWADWMAVAGPAAVAQFILISFSFAMLTIAFVTSDFSVELVANNSHSAKPMLYKVTGVWGNHEGSLLLWVAILALFGALISVCGGNLPPALKARTLAVQAMVGVAFLLFLLLTSNPFTRLPLPPADGNDLNPLLQDPGLAFHPPFLYLGYVGLSITFSFAIAALIEGRVDAAWARWVRPWALLAWVMLTIGIALGSWWAYYELGWGGWWFWDPVENASFMPWLLAAALLHSAIVVEKRDTLKSWTILLAILAFSFSLIGTFIVRSGVLTSVHAFATDPTRGMFILLILVIAIGGSLTLYAMRADRMKSSTAFALASRESGLVLNNVLLAASCGVVFVGTMWPLFAEALTGDKISVGPPFFNVTFTPFMVALAMILPIGSMIPWKRGKLDRTMRPLWGAMALSVALGAYVWAIQTGGRMLAPIGAVLAAWILLGVVADLWQRAGGAGTNLSVKLRRLRGLPRADWGKAISHSGLGVMIWGVVALTGWQSEDIRAIAVGESFELSGYTFRLDSVERIEGPNYISDYGTITVFQQGAELTTLHPEKRFYPVQGMPTTEAGISSGAFRDLYVSLGDIQDDGRWAMWTWVKPFANWIWAGAIIMSLGGFMSLSDRRYRVGLASARKPRTPSAGVPAE
ncbi:heme lyase CcmF/NrfE family subunit [Pontivivens insulae]|uniref:Cytochrome c-type biogenesis protein CcmF n=1 Tax=Pontivivens insulae TaxID=1639689 RepID=A0A2R8ABW5_9RHOB|nr:heme lyase CcmF/NrfE family subunit [Pontivivens insulae]RED11232.1 cytochrome c-type biogenesis protein CcmF [Pontivivens insulae]SPF29595.1 Cytochrome c-type biogenesis protein CcmF [Pontivivens insulae]